MRKRCDYLGTTGRLLSCKSIELFLWYFWGLSCVFIVPYIRILYLNIRLVELSTALVLISLVIRIAVEKNPFSKKYIPSSLMIISLIYCLALFWPLGGVITVYNLGYTPQLESYLAPFRRLIITLILLIAYIYFNHEEWLLRESALIRGFLTGCIFITTWMIIEQAAFIIFRFPLNDIIFRKGLGLNPQHTFINLVGSGYTGLTMPLYRATGFAWDPGQSATLVALGWFLYTLLPEIIVGKRRLFFSVFMLLALPLSLSRTAIIGTAVVILIFLGIYFITSIVQVNLAYNKILKRRAHKSLFRFYSQSVILGFIVIVILVSIACIPAKTSALSIFQGLMSFIKSGLEAQTFGEQRHWTYFTLIPYALTLNWSAVFLGYGTANVGVAIEEVGWNVLPEIEQMTNRWKGNWNPESTTVNFALMGGAVTLFALAFCLITSIAKAGSEYLRKPYNIQLLGYITILLVPFVLGLGYGFESTIIYISVFLIFIHIWDPKMRYI